MLAPPEAELRDANDDYHDWDLALMSGKRALSALYKIDAVADTDSPALIIVEVIFGAVTDLPSDEIAQRVGAINHAADAIRGFANVLRILARSHPEVAAEADSAPLVAIADRLSRVRTRIGAMAVSGQVDRAKRTIASIMTSVERASGVQRGGVADAQGRLEEVNHQIALTAWSKIPARLRPPGR